MFMQVTKDTKKRNEFVRQGKPTEITVKWSHNHPTSNSAFALKFLPTKDDVKQKFLHWFEMGMTVQECVKAQLNDLELESEDCKGFQYHCASGAENPPARRVSYWYIYL